MSGPSSEVHRRPGSEHPRVLLSVDRLDEAPGLAAWVLMLVRGTPEVRWLVQSVRTPGCPSPRPLRLPPNARSLRPLVPRPVRRLPSVGWPAVTRPTLPEDLARGLLGQGHDPFAVVDALVRCRLSPALAAREFRSAQGRAAVAEVVRVAIEAEPSIPAGPDGTEVARAVEALWAIASTAAAPIPAVDMVHAVSAGPAAIPGIVQRALHGTPLVLTEHDLPVDDGGLHRMVGGHSATACFLRTRLAHGLARAAYATADLVAPTTVTLAELQVAQGASPDRVRVIRGGVAGAPPPPPPATAGVVVSLGRTHPDGGVHTALRVAAEVVRRFPDVSFLHLGEGSHGQRPHRDACTALHRELGLGDRFRFLEAGCDRRRVIGMGTVVLLAGELAASTGLLLEVMAEERPVVAPRLHAGPELLGGCGLLAAPGDVGGLATAVCTLLRSPALAQELGRRARARVVGQYGEWQSLQAYRAIFSALSRRFGEAA
ncbi:MAG: polysaccharide biosynthesis protein PelF [Chloroflexota bacterium]|nr:polysaccharide biosynthesis protein PelF [Chloroflexota bacterium]